MSIEKKSLISNRIASKKAIVTKPEGSKVASTKMMSSRVLGHTKAVSRIAVKATSVTSAPNTRLVATTRLKSL
ncbi:MAG: hypothetical protein DMG93_05090 [Acidobacteria bacterium]|nr:MAG: hypothetical protein DMG93_05090 [Acidobacteriota bacterium]